MDLKNKNYIYYNKMDNNEKLNKDFNMSVSFVEDVLEWEESTIKQLKEMTNLKHKKEFVDWLNTHMYKIYEKDEAFVSTLPQFINK